MFTVSGAFSGYTLNKMRMHLACFSLILMTAPLRAEDSKAPAWIDAAAQPTYQTAEKIADGLYGFVRSDLIGPLLPESLNSGIDAAPNDDSYATFMTALSARQTRAARRDWEALPAQGAVSAAVLGGYFTDSMARHRDAVLDAFAASLASRYRVKRFGRDSGDLLRDPENWSADVLASATLFGGAYAYFAGVRTDLDAGPVQVGLDLAPGASLKAAALSSDSRRLARVSLSPRNSSLSFYGEWGASLSADRVGASWSSRF